MRVAERRATILAYMTVVVGAASSRGLPVSNSMTPSRAAVRAALLLEGTQGFRGVRNLRNIPEIRILSHLGCAWGFCCVLSKRDHFLQWDIGGDSKVYAVEGPEIGAMSELVIAMRFWCLADILIPSWRLSLQKKVLAA